jgi:hypothetical protein
MQRSEAIKKLQDAYENEKLGFQNNMGSDCKYYCSTTKSFCAVGVLIGEDDSLKDGKGDIQYPFSDVGKYGITLALKEKEMSHFHGLTVEELSKLQDLHDEVSIYTSYENEQDFKDYLYSLN